MILVNLVLLAVATCSCLASLLPLTAAQCSGSRISEDETYTVSWTVTGDSVAFEVSAVTTGWVGLGFSVDSIMVS